MSRTIIFTIMMLAASVTTLHFLDNPVEQRPHPIGPELANLNQETVSLVVNYRAFKGTLDSTLDSLERRAVNLDEASVRVYNAAKQYCPVYLEWIAFSDPAPLLEVSVARNLVGHIRSLEEVRPELAKRTRELERELEILMNHSACERTVR